ncbi:peptidoglycan editing factor PgeF [Candidatus Sumerlaeota bacterium]|nr:peptidoglycan editing factor PgeF [Candidatus Sumerlaeota bacterium]
MSFPLVAPRVFESLPWLHAGMTVRGDSRPDEDRLELARRLPGLLGLSPPPVVVPEQVHKDVVVEVGDREDSTDREVRDPDKVKEIAGADGLATSLAGVVIGVFSADCVPIVLADPDSRRIAAIHAGREGTRLGIARRAVERMIALGSDPARLLAWIAPAISGERYEVGEEIARDFRERFGQYPGAVRGRLLSLGEIDRRQLIDCGLEAERIELDPRCTFERADLFYSYRRDGSGTGRMLTFAVRTG